ncbi:MAG: PRTRC system protein E [Steroidobacteraceae bacterium]
MSDVFSSLETVLLDGESLDFKISRAHSKLTVLLIPHLPAAPLSSSPEAEQARAALSWPLRLEMTGAELDADFEQRVRGYAAQRRTLRESYDVLMSELKEADKATRARANEKAARRSTAKATGTPDPAPAAPQAQSPEPADAPCALPAKSDAVSDMAQPMGLFD